MNLPLVTVAIASYNHARFIHYAMDSILLEDYPDKEILIIDDGSTDNSVEIIQEWVDRNKENLNIKFISRANKGLSITLNELFDNAKGEYIAYLASDDVLCNNGISKRIALLRETGKMLVVGDSTVINDENTVTFASWMKDFMKVNVKNYETEKGMMKEILMHPALSGSILLIHRDIYNKIGKIPENFYAEEYFLYQRASALRLMVYLDLPVCYYRRHDGNQSREGVSNKSHLVKSIIKSYGMNWRMFPGKLKLVAFIEWLRWIKAYLLVYRNK